MPSSALVGPTEGDQRRVESYNRVTLRFWPMESGAVKFAVSWKCPQCLEQEAWDPTFHARTLATTFVYHDLRRETRIWHQRKPGGRDRNRLESLRKGLRGGSPVMFGFMDGPDIFRWPISSLEVNREPLALNLGYEVLAADDECRVPCGRRHGGADGTIVISEARLLAELKRIAF
jgi:hypothetical protein